MMSDALTRTVQWDKSYLDSDIGHKPPIQSTKWNYTSLRYSCSVKTEIRLHLSFPCTSLSALSTWSSQIGPPPDSWIFYVLKINNKLHCAETSQKSHVPSIAYQAFDTSRTGVFWPQPLGNYSPKLAKSFWHPRRTPGLPGCPESGTRPSPLPKK